MRNDDMFICLCFLLFWNAFIFAENSTNLSFQDLSGVNSVESAASMYHGREVTVRGFLYQSLDGRWILASEPNLKTCCVGSPRKVWQQIIVDGEFESVPANKVVQIAGTLRVDPVQDDKNAFTQVFRLVNPHLVQEDDNGIWLWIVMSVIGLMAISYFAIRYHRQKA